MQQVGPASGFVFRVERARGPQWYGKWREPGGRQVKRRIGPAWTSRGRPAPGFFTRRTAEDWLRATLLELDDAAARGADLSVTFAEAAHEWLRYVEEDRAVKATTLRDYRSGLEHHLLPAFGERRLVSITATELERWRATLRLSPRTKNKLMIAVGGIYRRAARVYGIAVNPAAQVERLRERRQADIDVFSPEEVWALVRAAADEQDAAVFLTAAFTGLRKGELIALRWRDVDFTGAAIRVRASYAMGQLTSPKSGKVRAVPLAPDVATALARLADRGYMTGDDNLVFVGELGGYVDGSALRRRYLAALDRAGLRRLRFHDLRHTFGTRVIAKADIVRVQEWMGHADIQTTRRYLHFRPQHDDAALVAEAFAVAEPRSLVSA
ncbi:MAG TPA: tyrosine-type recombinase/integrase [Solirubrobacteraceae bacterium]|nr:tyrosine-type recombinase/integrase [Solirubrobacteraceae bacterium]